ncbi:MAG: hypothetical protein DRI88_03160, partial [Bacteroidetes bacterium]
ASLFLFTTPFNNYFKDIKLLIIKGRRWFRFKNKKGLRHRKPFLLLTMKKEKGKSVNVSIYASHLFYRFFS